MLQSINIVTILANPPHTSHLVSASIGSDQSLYWDPVFGQCRSGSYLIIGSSTVSASLFWGMCSGKRSRVIDFRLAMCPSVLGRAGLSHSPQLLLENHRLAMQRWLNGCVQTQAIFLITWLQTYCQSHNETNDWDNWLTFYPWEMAYFIPI